MSNQIQVIGHRGAMGYEPENTIAAFERAIADGADMVEFDVHQCASGELIVFHDDYVSRVTRGQGRVSLMTLEELKALDVDGEPIPTLAELFDVLAGRCKLDLEIKDINATQAIIEFVRERVDKQQWNPKDIIIASFDHHQLVKCKEALPAVMTGALMTANPIDGAAYAARAQANIAIMNHEFMTQELCDDAHKRNLKVYVFTANEPQAIQRVIDLGVDGIITNYPDRVRDLCRL